MKLMTLKLETNEKKTLKEHKVASDFDGLNDFKAISLNLQTKW